MTALTVSKMDGVPTEMLLPEGFLNLGQTATYVPVSRLGNPRIVVAARSQNMTVMELGKCLLVAARDGRTEEVRDLMSKGAPFTTDWLGTSPLHLAAAHNHVETCEVLLRAGICKDARTKVDRTPLHMAAYEGHKDVVELLLLNSADVDCRDMLKMTPLHWAVQNEHKDCVQLLLEYGASIDAVSKFEKTPVILAIEQNRPDILQLLQMSIQLASEKQHNVELQQATLAATQSITNTGPIDLDEDEDSGDAVEITKINMLEQAVSDHKFTRIHNGDDVGGSSDRETNSLHRDTNETIRLLEAHGITMIPADDSSLVASAMESGQTVVLTEAGKLALNSTKPINGTSPNKIPSPEKQMNNSNTKVKGRKVITMRADQFLAMAGINSQMLKKVQQTKPVKRIVMAKNKIVVSPRQTAIQQSPERREPDKELTLEEAKRQLIEAKRIAENYKCLLRQKDLEINEYKKQIELLKLQRV